MGESKGEDAQDPDDECAEPDEDTNQKWEEDAEPDEDESTDQKWEEDAEPEGDPFYLVPVNEDEFSARGQA